MARKMKDSGVEWIGLIPEDWGVIPLKYKVTLNESTLSEKTSPDYEFDYIEIGSVNLIDGIKHYEHMKFADAPSRAKRIVKKDDIIVSTVRTYLKAIAKIPDKTDLIVSTGFAVLSPHGINANYLGYMVKTNYFTETVTSHSVGVSYPAINAGDLVQFKILIPQMEEQQKIADFLDEKVGEIDTIIAKTKESIEEYKKYRNSVISEKIIFGMDKTVPMKNSNVEWCPIIPEHWNVINPKALFTLRKEKAKKGDKQLTASQKKGIMYQDEYMESEGVRVVVVQKDFDILKHVEPDDFIISMRSFQGGLEYSELRGCISSAYVMLIPNKDKVYSQFYKWFFKSSKYINAIQSTSNLVRDGQAMRYSNFAQITLLDIPINEQQEIAKYLDEKCGEIDALIAKKEAFIEEMEMYKKSLIYEYVTGKKEVL